GIIASVEAPRRLEAAVALAQQRLRIPARVGTQDGAKATHDRADVGFRERNAEERVAWGAGLGDPGGAAVDGAQDFASPCIPTPGRACVGVGEANAVERVVGAAGLGGPGGAAVDGAQDRATVSNCSARVRVGERHAEKVYRRAGDLGGPGGAAVD